MEGKKTPCAKVHEDLGGKMENFHGWYMPIQYSGLIKEHNNVRNAAGLFDVSHMGEFLVFGPQTCSFLDWLVTNDVKNLEIGQCLYTPMCYEEGGIVDDLIILRQSLESYMLVVNASNIQKDLKWIKEKSEEYLKSMDLKRRPDNIEDQPPITIRDLSDATALIAIQGPKSELILQKLVEFDLSSIKRFRFVQDVSIGETQALIARTGYTGEDGFEIYVHDEFAIEVYKEILEAGKGHGLLPVGLGARDTLRLEAALMLYGNDISKDITPLEAPLSWTVKFSKADFVGKEALSLQKEKGVEKRVLGFILDERGVPRQGYEVFQGEDKIGMICSGTFSPTLSKGIGLAVIESSEVVVGSHVNIHIRDKMVPATIVKLPFYRRT